MPVDSQRFDVRDSDLDSQIETAEPGGTIDDREVVSEGANHVRVFWFYTEA